MKLKLLILVLALQCGWVLYTVAVQERALSVGKVITLETERVDPRDLLRGDYLILNYKISGVPTNLFSPPVSTDLPAGTKVYVALESRGDFFAIARAGTKQFEPSGNQVLLKASSSWSGWAVTNAVHVEYGFERYYVSEGTGNPRGKLTVQAVVLASGRAPASSRFSSTATLCRSDESAIAVKERKPTSECWTPSGAFWSSKVLRFFSSNAESGNDFGV